MQIISVKINNFFSIADAELEFGDSGLVLLEGWNFDSDRAIGAGKTAVFNAISFAVYGKIPRNITISEVLRRGCKRGFVEVRMKDKSGNIIKVVRSRPAALLIEKNGIAIDYDQAALEKEIGLSFDQFLLSMYSAQINGQKLIELNDSAKKEFFLQLIDMSKLNDYARASEVKCKELQTQQKDIATKRMQINERINELSSSRKDVDFLQACLIEKQTALRASQSDQALTLSPDTSKYDSLIAKCIANIALYNNSIANNPSIRREITIISNEIQKRRVAEKSLKKIVCSECNAELAISDVGVTALEVAKADINNKIEQLIIEQQSKENALVDETDIKEKIRAADNIKQKAQSQKSELLAQWSRKEQEWMHAQSKLSIEINSIQKDIAYQADINNKIQVYKDKDFELENQEQGLNEALLKWELVRGVFSPLGIQAYLLDSVVQQFNTTVQKYISMIWDGAQYQILTHRENKDKSVVAKMSEELIIDSNKVSIGSLSGGEYRCLSLATDFALIDTLSSFTGAKLNPIMLDESFLGLDEAGREQVIKMLVKISEDRQVWVIDHAVDIKNMFTRVVSAEKKAGITTIVDRSSNE